MKQVTKAFPVKLKMPMSGTPGPRLNGDVSLEVHKPGHPPRSVKKLARWVLLSILFGWMFAILSVL